MNIENISNPAAGLTGSNQDLPDQYVQSDLSSLNIESERAAEMLGEESAVSERIEEITEENLQDVEEAVDLLEHAAAAIDYDLEFNILPSENVIQARLLEGESGELIREIPPSEVIERRKRLRTFMGLMVDIRR